MGKLIGTKRLTRLAIRRDRITVPVTIVIALLIAGGSAPALASAYPKYQEQLAYVAASVPSIVGRLFQGTVNGVSLGTIMMAETYLFTAVILAIMSIFIVTRHTRYNEENGAGELIGSAVVGRNSPLTAALFLAVLGNVVTAVLLFGVLATVPELDSEGAFFYVASLAMVGIFFACIAAITAQLSDYKRGSNGWAIGALGLAFIIRAFGDALGSVSADGLSVAPSWISWLSPLGWGYQVLPWTDNRVFPLILLLVGSLVAVTAGYVLLNHRDLGSSIFQSKPGRARAKQSLLGASGLTRKLQRGTLIAWGAGFLVTGIMMGVVMVDFRETFEENEAFQNLISSSETTGGGFIGPVFAAMFPLMMATLSGYMVSAISKMSSEEVSGRIEYLLSTALGRVRWFLSHTGYIIIGIISLVLVFGLSAAAGYAQGVEDEEVTFGAIVEAAILNIPAMFIFAALILLVFSLRGRLVKTFAWFYYGYCVLIATLSGIFEWPDWVQTASPFYHTPAVPSDSINYAPAIIMCAMALALMVVAAFLFRTRDLNLK